MGPQGKNLINKAYRSTKSSHDQETESTEYTNDPDMDSEFSHLNQTLDPFSMNP